MVFKTAKRCLKRLLRKESNQQEALPNLILKECVRPALNILSQKGQFPALYVQLTNLINVLHACFNEQLGKHLVRCYEQNRLKIAEKIQLHLEAEPQDGLEHLTAEEKLNMKQARFNACYESLVLQYNHKVENLEIANHIVKILYLLPTNRTEICKILLHLPDFEQ